MIYSFTAIYNTHQSLSSRVNTLGHNIQFIDIFGWQILLKFYSSSPAQLTEFLHIENGVNYLLIGTPINLEELRSIASVITSEAMTANTAHVLAILQRTYGNHIFSLAEGAFNFLTFYPDNRISLVNDSLGFQPVHFIQVESFWITSELKTVGQIEPDLFEFSEETAVVHYDTHKDDFLPIKNAERLKPGCTAQINIDGLGFISINKYQYLNIHLVPPQYVNPELARRWVYNLISDSVARSVNGTKTISIPLSGGLDSSMVTALAAKYRNDINTISIGSTTSNEYEFAQIVSRYVNTSHREVTLSDEQILQGAHEAIYYNEIFDGLSVEIQSSFLCLYRLLKDKGGRLVTGYGADLLFGGVLNPDCKVTSINSLLWSQVYRTRWTGEFSVFGSGHYGIEVNHPFWTTRMMGFALSLAPDLKVSLNKVKILLRECADEFKLLPNEIVWRKKIGIHQGSSINNIFASQIGVEKHDYAAKTRYAYRKYQAYLTGREVIA
ncbi:asparagine synthetase B family protein [Microcoleus sp. N9_A1]|uniref:asparagine synthetase B family protein n=1 Tax=Microcoleus sp. N9_A1 TaxID=3055380 RepID=UPI002FD0D233